jgi:gas vesicle protein
VNVSSGVSPAAAWIKHTVKESSMRVKKRVKRGVKKGIKSVKSAPPQAYLAGVGVLVGGAAVVLLTTTKSGRELLIRTAQLALRPVADEKEFQESDVQDTDGDDESEVADLKPRNQRPRTQEKVSAPRKATSA